MWEQEEVELVLWEVRLDFTEQCGPGLLKRTLDIGSEVLSDLENPLSLA